MPDFTPWGQMDLDRRVKSCMKSRVPGSDERMLVCVLCEGGMQLLQHGIAECNILSCSICRVLDKYIDCGVEQSGQLVGLITRRSVVQIRPPRPRNTRPEAKTSGLFYFSNTAFLGDDGQKSTFSPFCALSKTCMRGMPFSDGAFCREMQFG